jgi:hypothetical protein
MAQVLQGVEHRGEMGAGLLEVEVLGESFEVDVGRVHPGVERASRCRMHVARRDRHAVEAERVAGIGSIHRVLGEDHWVVVGEGYARGTARTRRLGDPLGRRRVHQAVHLAALRDVPVLAELARQVAAGGAEAEHSAAREEVVERLLLDRVDAEARAASVGGEHHRVADALAHEAHAALALVQPAVARTQVALDAAIVEPVPPAAR